jgi:serine phosphatase RsbU (regulator of sigma subunit)
VLDPGDTLVLYTDGVVEVMNEQQQEFGMGRMMEILKRSRSMSVEEIIGEVILATQEFAGSESSDDDFTLVIVRRE